MPIPAVRRFKPRFSLASLFWMALAIACVFAGRASTRWGTDLKVQNLAFCDEIRGYGQADRLANPRFVGGQSATFYLEVQNFSQKKLSDSFETNLQGNYEILDKTGVRVHTRRLPADRQESTTRKHDHFIAYRVAVPPLPPGQYDLKVDIRDANTARDASATVPFVVASSKQ